MHETRPSIDLVSSAQAATIHGVDVTTINRWAKSGRLRVVVKAPGRTGANLFDRAEVEALLPQPAVSA